MSDQPSFFIINHSDFKGESHLALMCPTLLQFFSEKYYFGKNVAENAEYL